MSEAIDPWVPDDPDEPQDPQALLDYWQTANESPAAQRQLVADRWRLWRLARDLAAALENRRANGEDPRDFGLTAADLRLAADRLYQHGDSRLEVEQHTHAEAERYGRIRSRLRGLADAIEQDGA